MRIAVNAINSNRSLGGVDRYLIELLTHLQKVDKNNKYYVFYAPWQNFIQALNFPRIKLIELSPPRNKVLRALWHLFWFPILLYKYKPDILHYTNPMLFLWTICPVIVTVHDMAEFSSIMKYGKLNSYLKRIIAKLNIRFADQVITVSNFSKNDISRIAKINKNKIKVILEGVSQRFLLPQVYVDISRKYSLPSNYLLFVGAIKKGKNIESILQAFSEMHDSLRRELAIVVVGRKGNAYSRLCQLIKELDLTHHVYFLDHVEDEDLLCIYRDAKIFVFPSLIEGFGLPALEAMASGVPVIASNTTSLPEVCGDAAILVDPLDPEALRQAIEKILKDQHLVSSLIQKGLKRAKMLSWDITAKETLSVYRIAANVF